MKNLLFAMATFYSCFLHGQGTVTSVNISASPSLIFNWGGGPITNSGTLTISLDDQNETLFLAGPPFGGGSATPSFRLIDPLDLPLANADQQGAVSTSSQTFAGVKTFNNGLVISTTKTIKYGSSVFIQGGGGSDDSFFGGINAGGSSGNSMGHGNVGLGYEALKSLSTVIGEGNHNTAVGFNSLRLLTSALQNTMIGSGAGESLTSSTGSDGNTGVGFEVLTQADGASGNVAVGLKSGKSILTGSNNTFIGNLTAQNTQTGNNNILIGDNINTSSVSASNEISIGDAWFGNRSTKTLGIGISTPAATLHLKAGTASANTAPIKIESGIVNTTAEAGTIEYDGKTFYASPNATTGRGISPSVLFTMNASDFTMTNSTASQPVFNTTNDQISLAANTTYFFEIQITITGMSSTTRTINYVFGGTAGFSKIYYTAQTWSGAASAIATNQTSVNINSSGASTINITNTSAETTILIKGSFRTIATGTFIPQIAFSAAPGVLGSGIKCIEGSYLNLTPVGTNAVSFAGNWN